MPDRGFSRRLKAKLLRRSSTPSVAQTNSQSPSAASALVPPERKADSNKRAEQPSGGGPRPPQPSPQPNPLSTGSAPHLSPPPDDPFLRPRSYSVVSSLPVGSPSYHPDEGVPSVPGDLGSGSASAAVEKSRPAPSPGLSDEAQAASLPPPTPSSVTFDEQQQQQHRQFLQEPAKSQLGRVHSVSSTSSASKNPNSPLQITPPTEVSPSTAATTPAGASNRPNTGSSSQPPPSQQPSPYSNNPNAAKQHRSNQPSASSSYFPSPSPAIPKRPSLGIRRQSLLPASQHHLIDGLLDSGPTAAADFAQFPAEPATAKSEMPPQRKIWVKRPGGSATLVPVMEDWLVDELRDQILRKYGNSIGRNFDPPDIVVRILPREGSDKQLTPERVLSPEEPLLSAIDGHFPGGQSVAEALLIDTPQRRTPKPSPRHPVYYHPADVGDPGDYFTLVPGTTGHASSTHTAPAHTTGNSISILSTGVPPPLPSPGSLSIRHRPTLARHTTDSPAVLNPAAGVKRSWLFHCPFLFPLRLLNFNTYS